MSLRMFAVGAGVVLAAAGLTAGAAQVGLPAPAGAPSTLLPTSLGNPLLSCPGPETLEVPEGGSALRPGGAVVVSTAVGSGARSRVAVRGERSPLAEEAARTLPGGLLKPVTGPFLDLDAGPLAAGQVKLGALAVGGLGPVRVAADPQSSTTGSITGSTAAGTPSSTAAQPLLGAVQSTLARGGDLRGLTASACGGPAGESWLVGGGTRPGERLRLLLSNPADAPAVVDISVFGPDGRLDAPAGEGVAVPARGQVPLFIDALAPNLDRVVVHVVARTGRVRATLHDSMLRGLFPGGADDVVASAAPARTQVIPGISVLGSYAKGVENPRLSGATSVRVAVPGSEEAVVRIGLVNSAGATQLPAAAVQNVKGGSVVDIPVARVPAGTYSAVVRSDVPVVAGARVGRKGGAGRTLAAEFGWAGAGTPMTGTGVVPLPAGARSTLSLVPLGAGGSVQLTPIHADGRPDRTLTVSVSAGAASAIQLEPDVAAIGLSGFTGGRLAGAVVATVDDARGQLISVVPLRITAVSASTVRGTVDERLGLR